MPKFPKGFGRRKSTANAFECVEDLPVAEPSFKVFERPDGASRSFDGALKMGKAPPSRPLTAPKHKEDNIFDDIKGNRGSGASNTNTMSTTDNSSRLSGASTAPSSTLETHANEEWRSAHDKPFHDIPLPPVPKAASAFSLKNAGRSLSWGRIKSSSTPPTPSKDSDRAISPVISGNQEGGSSGRSRAVTGSSYASTATPPKLEDRDLGLSLGGDFSDMFSGFGKRKSVILDAEKNRGMSHSPEYTSSLSANRSYSSGRLNQPSPLQIDQNKEIETSPYSWSSQHSNDGLISNSSPPLPTPPPVPAHGVSRSHDSPSSTARPPRPGGPVDSGLRRSTAFSARRQSTLEYTDSVDEDARLLRESVNASRRLNDPSANGRVRDSWALPSSNEQYTVSHASSSSWGGGSTDATPRAKRVQPQIYEDELFDSNIAESAHLAQRFEDKPVSPPTTFEPQNKVMTPAQFERYKQDQENLKSVGGGLKDDDDDETYDDEEDEAEKNRQLAKQRRKQEAHMAVYRQQMMKLTGDAPSAARPSVFATQSTPNLLANGQSEEGEEDDEEVPLAILAAHGFPSKNKPPTQLPSTGSSPNLRGSAQAGPGGGSGSLPVFARNLPQDPYFGAGIVHPTHRESLAFGGGSPRNIPSGGLVGVIASEERSRAMRRGSPNAQGEYGPAPANGFNGMGMPHMGPNQPGMMMNGMGPMGPMGAMGPMGPMGPMILTPGDQAQIEMSNQMQQFMQMQMQFMQMMTSGQGVPQQNGQGPQPPRPQSAQGQPQGLRPGSTHQRTLTMLDPNSAPWMQNRSTFAPSIHNQGAGYAPSIAPSERSNIGLPGRYRPVSHVPAADNRSRTSTMSGALQGWENKNAPSKLNHVKKSPSASDEEDDEGWEAMKMKRDKKKSLWRTKKEDSSGLKEMLTYAQ